MAAGRGEVESSANRGLGSRLSLRLAPKPTGPLALALSPERRIEFRFVRSGLHRGKFRSCGPAKVRPLTSPLRIQIAGPDLRSDARSRDSPLTASMRASRSRCSAMKQLKSDASTTPVAGPRSSFASGCRLARPGVASAPGEPRCVVTPWFSSVVRPGHPPGSPVCCRRSRSAPRPDLTVLQAAVMNVLVLNAIHNVSSIPLHVRHVPALAADGNSATSAA